MPIRNNSPKVFYLGKERQKRGGKRYSELLWEVHGEDHTSITPSFQVCPSCLSPAALAPAH